ncbi:MAG TPA: hypothetical protein VGE91_06710 [Solirubrobacterales bacterium]|jgi:hypothetical protein
MPWKHARFALVVLLVPLLVAAAPAEAKKKRKKAIKPPSVVTATASASSSADGELVSPAAVCPSGTVALGGGFSSEVARDEEGVTDLFVVYESRRDSPTSWRVGAAREDAGGQGNPISISVTAYCQSPTLGAAKRVKKKKKPKKRASAAGNGKKHKKHKRRKLLISEVSSTGPAAERGDLSSATASCPSGLNAISGGFSVTPPPALAGPLEFPLVWADHAAGANAWTASETTSSHTPLTLTSYAYCANTSAPLALTGSGSADPETTGSATAPPCPADRPVISGGFNDTAAAAGGVAELAFESTGSGGGWTTSSYNVSSQPASLQAIAYCR